MCRMNQKKIQILRIPGHRSWCKENQDPNPIQLKKKGEAKEGTSRMMQPKHNLGKIRPDHEPPQQPRQLEQEETPIQQPKPQPQQQPPQDDVIDLSSCSDDKQPPHHMDVVHPLVPKVEKLQEDQLPPVLEQPSQSVVEVVPIYPTQEVIDVSSSSEDERPPLIPKTEQLDPYSPGAKIISEVLISMNRDEAPSLDLGIDPPLPQREEKAKDQFQTPQPIKSIENQKELEEKAVAWAAVPKGGDEFETIFKLAGDMFLEAMRYQFQSMAPKNYIDIQVITIMCHILNKEQNERFEKFVYCVPPEIMVRMFEKHGQSWMDTKNNRPHAIASLVNHEEYMVYLDKKKLLTHRFSNILDQLRIWAGAPSIFDQGSCSLLPRYVNIPGQPNETDCGVFVMKWMELIDPTGLEASCEANRGYNIDKWGEFSEEDMVALTNHI
ncbi:hypothetical protein PIB30_041812 [Stylosanthes scabra]|uniref:Ubiquitin-like protease family profile domain-containing protein n=1 Tax=Stylosanthes scabra TaxID=79078 RepID=A0ABU6ZDU0_9FABA|nr:hypothetical protein [Stylosanthes scabra]